MAVKEQVRLGKSVLQMVRTMKYRSGARGLLYLPDSSAVHTLEDRPIPAGAYFLNPDETGKHRNWIIESVLGSRSIVGGRVDVEVRAGNTLRDSEGCILTGMSSATHGVVNSKISIDYMRDRLDRNGDDPRVWLLHITEAF